MTIRTFDDLSNSLSGNLAWRKKELLAIKYYIDLGIEDKGRLGVLSRCGIAILYAHWEGFIKIAGQNYLEFVAMQRLKNDQLSQNFLAISMRSTIPFSANSQKISEYGKFTNFFFENLSNHAKIPYKKGLDTESNLSSTVLKEITWCLGIDYSPFESKEKFIDSRLLAQRNHIAHGQEIAIEPDDFKEMREITIEMMTIFKNEIENNAVLGKYMTS
jgi:hypothetical protein